MTGTVKNQHFVPQSYIDRFAVNGKISVFFKEDGQLFSNQNSRNYAADRYYYDANKDELKALLHEMVQLVPKIQQHIDWNDPQLIEHYFSRSEGAAKELLDKIERDPSLLDTDECVARIVIFLHDLCYRNHKYRDDIAKINAITHQALAQMNLTEDQQLYAEKEYGVKQARDQQFHAITSIVPALQTCQKLIEDYDLFFATAEKDACFVISDDPAFAVRFDLPEICFPLSGKHALLFRKPSSASKIMGTDVAVGKEISITIPNVVKYNLLQFCAASRYVFGDAHNLSQMKLLWEMRYSKQTTTVNELEG